MSEIRGPMSAIAQAFVDPIRQHQNLPPDKKILAQVSLAAHVLGWCAYLCPLFKTGPFALAVLLGVAFFGNGKAPDWWLPVEAWAGLTAVSALWLAAAWRAAQGQVNAGAFPRLVLAGALAALLWYRVYPDWGPLAELILKGFYIAWLASAVCRFLLAAQLFGGGSAERAINRELRRRNRALMPARRR